MIKSFLTMSFLFAAVVSCGDGKDGATGTSGVDGKDGKDGASGVDGVNGKDGDTILLSQIRNIYNNYRQSVYRVTVQCNGTGYAFGSAFRISSDKVATNKHVVSYICPVGQIRRFKLQAVYDSLDTLETGTLYGDGDCPVNSSSCAITATYVASTSFDLAKLTIPSALKGKSVVLSTKSSVTVGQPLLSMSFPLGFEDLYTLTGSVSSNYLGECHGGADYECPALDYDFISSLDTDHGSSGSPIFDLVTGEVIGVTSAGTEGENMNTTWAIYASRLSNF